MQRVVLTFDDGPHPRWTREVLRVLAAARPVQATFFVWGEQAVEHADVVSEVLQAGHSVQPHCFRHRRQPDLTATQISTDIDQVIAVLGQLGVEEMRLWRPPWGQLRKGTTSRVARQRGLGLVGWNVDSHDWSGGPAGEMYTYVKAQMAELGSRDAVVLMHDNCVEPLQAAHRSGCEGTVELVRRLIDDDQLAFGPLVQGVPDNLNEQRGRAAKARRNGFRLRPD